jgi:hypothetical protein
VRRVKHVKSHFQYEAHDQSTTQEEIWKWIFQYVTWSCSDAS